MNYAVVIPSYERIADLKSCIDCINANLSPKPLHIVAVMQCEPELPDAYKDVVSLHYDHPLGAYGARNAGLRHLLKLDGVDYVLSIDDDSFFLKPVDLRSTLHLFEKPDTGIVCLKISRSKEYSIGEKDKPKPILWMSGGFLTKVSLFRSIGLFACEYLEALELSLRSYLRGFVNYYTDRAISYHIATRHNQKNYTGGNLLYINSGNRVQGKILQKYGKYLTVKSTFERGGATHPGVDVRINKLGRQLHKENRERRSRGVSTNSAFSSALGRISKAP